MRHSYPLLVSAALISVPNRWRLVDEFFLGAKPAIEACGAIGVVAAVGWVRCRGLGFVAALVLCMVLMVVRVLHTRHYQRHVKGQMRAGDTPERWALHFLILSWCTASLWALLNVAALATQDCRLQLIVMVVQSGWIGATCTRNAASPATVLGQAMLVIPPSMLCMILSRDPLLYTLIPIGALAIPAVLSIARTLGERITAAMLSEQALEAANARLLELSTTDALTGISNRRGFDAALTAEWARAARDGTDLALLIIDVDWFKNYNDCYGHPAGDECLRLLAEVTARTLRRPPDIAARFGGEEFAAILPGTNQRSAMEVGERIRAAIAGAAIPHQASALAHVTVSIGAMSLSPHPGTDRQTLIELADRALYHAKKAGRNRVADGGPSLPAAWTQGTACAAPSAACVPHGAACAPQGALCVPQSALPLA